MLEVADVVVLGLVSRRDGGRTRPPLDVAWFTTKGSYAPSFYHHISYLT